MSLSYLANNFMLPPERQTMERKYPKSDATATIQKSYLINA